MKKIILITSMLLIAVAFAKAQSKKVVKYSFGFAALDSTLKATDTTYTAVNNIAYREIHYRYLEPSGVATQCSVRAAYDGTEWIFNQLTLSPCLNERGCQLTYREWLKLFNH